jgi:DNA-binding GntR family transcriptional regulator
LGQVIKNFSLSEQVCDLLKDAIIKGELKPGDRIIELEVAKKYNVSQAPVREALSRLKKEGFVIHHRHKGSFVSNFSKKDIDEIYSFRDIMEPFALSRAIKKLNDDDIKELEKLYEEMVKAGENNNLDQVLEIDNAFHSYIYNLADHGFMNQVWDDLSAVSNRVWYLTGQLYFEEAVDVAKLHRPILDALKERDLEKSIEAFKLHMNFVWDKIRSDK